MGMRVGIRIVTFEACAGFIGRPARTATQVDLCCEAPTQSVTRPSRAPASGFNRTIIRVEPSSTEDLRGLRACTAKKTTWRRVGRWLKSRRARGLFDLPFNIVSRASSFFRPAHSYDIFADILPVGSRP